MPHPAHFAYRRAPDQDRAVPMRHRVVIVGAGPVGLAAAIDLAQRGQPVVLLDDSDRIGKGSRAICFAKKTLEIFATLGMADGLLKEGVDWSRGRVFQRESELYAFDLLPEPGHLMPAFINISQFAVEQALVARAQALPLIDLRWKNRVISVQNSPNGAMLGVETPDGPYRLAADYVIAADGARSSLRAMLGLVFSGEIFEEQFLIADVRMRGDFPAERWFWFDPPFHAGGSALLHRQPNDIWRIDLQLPANADPEQEKRPESVLPRLKAMLGKADFSLEWVSIYRFRCLRLEKFIHDRVIFAGDAAHQVSPFGARGANSGIQDAENLAWKLAAILDGHAPPDLLASYEIERGAAADENLAHSTRSTDFIAPRSAAERVLRDAALALARAHAFAKRMVNSGRLSAPSFYAESPLSTPDAAPWPAGPAPGAMVPDARIGLPGGGEGFLSQALGPDFTLLAGDAAIARAAPPGVALLALGQIVDPHGDLAARFALGPGRAYLLRPDRHVAARFVDPSPAMIKAALRRARGKPPAPASRLSA